MTDIRLMLPNDNSSLSVPVHHHRKNLTVNISHLPPSPSSSSSGSSYINNSHSGKARDLSLKLPDGQQKYGSLGSSTPYSESLNTIERPLTPSQTTISPNDDDEGLYLLWTQQLLREKGFAPSSCRPEFEDDMGEHQNGQSNSSSVQNEVCDDDSSVSDMSFSSDDDMEDQEEDDDNDCDRYIAEQRKLLINSPAPSGFPSHQPSLISRYSTINYYAAENDHRTEDAASQNSIYSIFKYFFPTCF